MKYDSNFPGPLRRRRWVVPTLVLVMAVWVVGPLKAQKERPTSLDIVPDTATFYLASMNHAAQYEAIINSNAYQQLMNCEVGKRMRKAYRSGRRNGFGQFGWSNPFANYLDGYAQSVGSVPGKITMNYLKDIFGNEVFVYGDQDWLDMSQALSAFFNEASSTMADVDDVNAMAEPKIRELLQLGRKHMQGVNTPKLVMGTVLDSPSGTKSLLQMGEMGIDELLNQIPPDMEYILEGYKVIEEDDLYLLTFQLDSEMVPWGKLESDSEMGPYVDDIKAILADKSINISVGVKGQFLLLSIGPDDSHLKSLGEGDLLIDLPQLAPLKAAGAKHALTSVRYTSEKVAKFNHQNVPRLVDTIMSAVKTGLKLDPVEELDGLIEDLESNVDELKSDIAAMSPDPGAYLGFSYIFENGIEGYVYNWAENKYLDGSKPLTIIDHVGQRPTMFVASRASSSATAQFQTVRKWIGRGFEIAMKYAARSIPDEDEAEMFVDVTSEVREILSQVADSTVDNLLAATSGDQSAMAMDFTTARKSWHDMMPESDEDLPIPSMALLIEHHDKDKISAAGASYLGAVEDFTELIRDLPNSDVPDEFQIQSPQMKSEMGGDLYFYPLPIQAGLDDSLTPHALLLDDMVVLGYSLDQTERLLKQDTSGVKGLLADRSKNMMAASYYNNREMVDALYTWTKYGISIAKEDGLKIEMDQDVENDTLAFTESEIMDAVEQAIVLLKCFESASSMSYMEGDAQVARYQLLFKDVPAKD